MFILFRRGWFMCHFWIFWTVHSALLLTLLTNMRGGNSSCNSCAVLILRFAGNHLLSVTVHTLQAYSAMLLGFIVADDAALRQQAAAALPGGSLAPVATAVEQCLQFYVAVGAMPEENERSLRQLVASLRQQQPGD